MTPTNDQIWQALQGLTDGERQLVIARIMGTLDAWQAYYPEGHQRLRDAIITHPFVAKRLGGAK